MTKRTEKWKPGQTVLVRATLHEPEPPDGWWVKTEGRDTPILVDVKDILSMTAARIESL